MIARVRSEIRSAIVAAVTLSVTGSTSAKTGMPPWYRIGGQCPHVGHRGRDHLLTGLEVERGDGGVHRRRAGRTGDDVLDAEQFTDGSLEAGGEGPLGRRQRAALEHLGDVPDLVETEGPPGGVLI